MTGTIRLDIEATHLGLRAIGPWLGQALAELDDGSKARELGPIELAVHELVNNCVDHAEPEDQRVSLSAHIEADELVVEIHDRGRPFVAVEAPDPAEPQVRGYGLMIVEQITSALDYQRHNGENRWTARFSLD